MDFAYVATGPSVTVFFGFFFLDFFFRNRPLPKKNFFFFFGEKFCDVEKKNFFLGGREAWEAGPPGREAWASSEPWVIPYVLTVPQKVVVEKKKIQKKKKFFFRKGKLSSFDLFLQKNAGKCLKKAQKLKILALFER